MATPEEAERIVKEVTEYYGYLDHDMMDDIGRFNSDYRRRIDENWLKMENAASHSIKVLARNIYGSGARFVFELLQNAEDNSFRKADDKNDPPFISFQIHPQHIVVECNEDGFTSLDLKAICSVGESTKTAKHGYVGAKGIGFKSVFIAASRVHIQSGNYSFEFRHNRNDPGLGMVRPIWVAPTETIPSPLTRTTLYLHEQGDEDEIQHLKTVIAMQFDDLYETCLLFLRKLSKISVTFFDGQGHLQRSKQFTKKKIDEYRVSLETTVVSSGKSVTTSQMYHITKQLATGLAQSESRDAATTEEARKSLTSAEVVLAFPLKSDYQPHISTRRQELFAFLPLRTSDYKDSGHDSFWSGLDAKILSLVQDNPILRSRNRSDLRFVREVMIASNGMTDDEGILLLDDPVKDPFISAKYPYKVTQLLKPYGLRVASTGLFVILIKRDLSQHDSKMRANTTANDWHSSVARLCSKICDNGWNGTTLLKSLEVLPLRNGHWTASGSGPVYFPMTGDTEIPQGLLCLKVLSKSAATNPDRGNLFRHLGATEATYEGVRSAIFSSFIGLKEMSFSFTFDCLRYLFLTHSSPQHTRESYKNIWLFTEEFELYSTHGVTIYLPEYEHPFSPASLLNDTHVPPDFPVRFLDTRYLSTESEDQKYSLSSYKRWLCDFIGIHERLTILSVKENGMSQPFQYVLAHYPAKFLGLFEHLWLLEGKEVLKHPTIVSQMKEIPAKELCKVQFSPNLENTWLPLPELKRSVRRYMELPGQFPFLVIEEDGDAEQVSSKWNFLTKHFGVGKSDDLEFLLEILHCIRRSCTVPVSIRQSQRVFELYIAVYAKLAVSLSEYQRRGLSDEDITNIGSLFLGTLGVQNISVQGIVSELECRWRLCGDDEEDVQILSLYKYLHEHLTVTTGVRATFEQSPLIFLRQDGKAKWYKTSDCLWSSTAPIRGKVTLDETYEDLKELFVAKLGVKSLTMQMVYDELRQSPESSVEDIKVALFAFNDFLKIEDGNWDPEPIRTAKIFPVVYPDGTTALRSIDVGFAIADRSNLRSKFSDQIALLDFELEDIHRLRPLFSWLKIQQRYLSRCVMERTAVSGDSRLPISSPKRDLGLKAYQICRVAATFRSPRFQHGDPHLYNQLRAMKFLEVEGISSVLRLSQNGRQYEARLSTASEHIDEPAGSLNIYVPRHRRAQEICFGSVLPRKFAAWLMRNPHTNIDGNVEVDIINALTSIFASDRAVLDEILDDQGMIQLQFEDPDKHLNKDETGDEQAEDNYASDSTPEPGYEVSDLVPTPTHSSMNSIIPSPVRDSEIEDGTLETEEEIVEIQSSTSHQVRRGDGSASRLLQHSPDGRPFSSERLENQRPIPSYPASQATEDQRYLTILERVIAAARLANFPSGGAFDLNGLRDALPDSGEQSTYLSYNGFDVLSRFQSTSQQERDKKIGAAGELYVFELLSKLDLPGWGRNNWKSTIRTYANIHPEYADLSHWSNRETADLVYSDTQGDLTRILVDAEVLSDDWSIRRPRYYIEVKTTTGPCGTPFYMSGNQYRLPLVVITRNTQSLIMASAQEAEEIIRSLNGDIKLGKHIEHSAKRLLPEILRYANSRSFTKVLAASEIPAITFRIHECDRIVIEYNDDGLTKADLEAICQPVSEEQTGEYNFRRIVVANRKVHIQSGNFSFDFQHNILDPEDSIMRPVWVSPTEILPNMTRITLYLHDQGSKEEVENLREIIRSQFDMLHDATLVFLKDIKWMRIEFLDGAGLVIRSKVLQKKNVGKHGVCIDITDADQRTEGQVYHVTDYSVDSSATYVTLAFPLTDDFTPRVDSVGAMQLFNLVPLCASPLAFHVHSHFEFEDEAHGIATTSAHNISIRDLIANAFFKAVLHFLDVKCLRYSWPLFLTPISEDTDPFWSALDSEIRSWISQNPVLRCKGSRQWRLISHLTRVPPEAQDENGKPLLDDPFSDSYLLHKYPVAAAAKLTEYGLATLTDTRLLELLEMDLESPKPRMHTSTSRDWQIAMSRLLSKLLTNDERVEKLKSLPIVQLRDGSWTSPASGPLYFPTSGHSSIPESLKFRDVTLLATFQPERRTSYEKLGVTEPTAKEVRQKILETFKSAENLPFGDVYEYLRYLYLSHQSFNLFTPHEQPYGDVRVLTTGMKLQNPHTTTVYYPGTDDPYSPESLLGPASMANFLHPKIWNDGADKPGPSHPTWKVWLCDSIGIRERPSLLQAKAQSESEPINDESSTDADGVVLSDAFHYVYKHHPDRLLGFIERLWIHEGHELLKHPTLVSEIRQLPAQKLCGVDFEVSLQDTWAPSGDLQTSVKVFMMNPDVFPFLKLDDEKDVDLVIATRWSFLTKHFGVKWKHSLNFLVQMMRCIKGSCTKISLAQIDKLMRVYDLISRTYSLSTSEEKARALEFFNDGGVLHVEANNARWLSSSRCVWSGPTGLVSKRSIKRFYIEKTCTKKQLQSIARLLVNELKIRDANDEDMAEELCALRLQECKDIPSIDRIYTYLDGKTISPETRRKFHELPLILVKQGGHTEWLRGSQCFWSEADIDDLNGNLQRCYPDLKDFFLEKLGVKLSAYDKLLHTNSDNPEDIKEIIRSFAEDVGESISKFSAEPIRQAKIFPVRSPGGDISLVSLDTDFAIADRQGLRRDLQDHIRILDFDLEDVRWLWRFFQWLKIEGRYLSRCTKRSATVSEDGTPSEEGDPWDLRHRAYHITRIAATFEVFAKYDDAASLYERLKALRVIEVSNIPCALEITQDQKAIQSTPQPVTAHISDDDLNFTIYVAKDKKKKIFSDLPRILEEWLRKDRDSGHTFEVISSLTSIFASDISALDEILEDQGIIQLPFENNDKSGAKMASEGASECPPVQEVVGKPSEEDQGESLVLRGRGFASEVAAQDGIL
ncbi:hypothetical protein FAGAP_7989 [Fusarium agapanthi]|uniref:Protein NO VEIN C-terminal domain-containing protein n=1 Tax=Fusarium agapanthi TaxID=1803897 RepID=A0A9P5BC17_9HYPO|nr:hypothetical protein FAGAP_7989 [Fusarium agapanthi]